MDWLNHRCSKHENLIRSFVKYESVLLALPLEEAKTRMLSSSQQFALSYGFAFAPNPDRHPPYFDYPFTEVDGQLVRDDEVWKKMGEWLWRHRR